MKVMFINSVVDYGSTGKIVRDLSDELKHQGHTVSMVYGRKSVKDETDTFSLVSPAQTAVHVAMTRLFGRHGLYSTKSTKRLIAHIKEFQPDTIHLHNLHGYYLNVPYLLNYLATTDIKLLWTLHDAWLMSGNGAYFDFNGIQSWYQEGVICNTTKDYPEAKLLSMQKSNIRWKRKALLQQRNLSFITPSQWLKDLIATSYLKSIPCYVVPNGIDTDLFKPSIDDSLSKQYESKKLLLGLANIWEPRKGLKDFTELNQLISDEYQIVLIGLTPQQIEDLPEGIIGLERTSSAEELAAYYSLAHAFINPTYEDNYPTTNLESLACKGRVIAYDTGGNKEVPGIEIVTQGDVAALWKTIQKDHDVTVDPIVFSKGEFIKKMFKFY